MHSTQPMRRFVSLVCFLSVFPTHPASANDTSEIETLRRQVRQLQQTVEQLQNTLQNVQRDAAMPLRTAERGL